MTLGTGSSGFFSIDVDTRAASRTLRVQGSGVTLTVAGQTIAGDVTLERIGTVTRLGLSNGSIDLGGYVTVSQGTGLLLLTPPASPGRSRDVALAVTVPSVAGSFSVAINRPVRPSLRACRSATGTVTLDLPSGPYLRLTATDVVVTVAGQVISGDLAVERSAPASPQGQQRPDAPRRRRRGRWSGSPTARPTSMLTVDVGGPTKPSPAPSAAPSPWSTSPA